MSIYQQALDRHERKFLMQQLAAHSGNQSQCAIALGIHRNTISRKLIALGITQSELDALKVPANY